MISKQFKKRSSKCNVINAVFLIGRRYLERDVLSKGLARSTAFFYKELARSVAFVAKAWPEVRRSLLRFCQKYGVLSKGLARSAALLPKAWP